jgi:KDO2-lipid IV(A) lauroyltransferase
VKKIIRQLYYAVALLFSKIVLLMPYETAVRCGGALGLLAYHVVSDARRITEQNLAAAFPGKTAAEIKGTAKQVFINQGKNLFELFSFPKIDGEKLSGLVSIDNIGAFSEGFSAGKGFLIASAHCGNWEIMAAAIARAGVPLNVIAKRIYIEGLNRLLVGMRNLKGVKVILRSGSGAARDMLRALRNKEALGLLIDQDTDVPGVFIEFFGRKAWTPSGLATLAFRTGAAVVLALDARMPDDTHEVFITGPIQMRKSGLGPEQDLVFNTQVITSLIEDHIRKYPAQWVWMHKRWKTQYQGTP